MKYYKKNVDNEPCYFASFYPPRAVSGLTEVSEEEYTAFMEMIEFLANPTPTQTEEVDTNGTN